jgi:hypothetical protein
LDESTSEAWSPAAQLSYTLTSRLVSLAAKFRIQQLTVTSEAAKKTVIDDMLTLHNVTIGDHLQVCSNDCGQFSISYCMSM